MDREPGRWSAGRPNQGELPDGDEDDIFLEFEDDALFARHGLRLLRRVIWRMLPLLLLTALLLAVAGQPNLVRLFLRTADNALVPITVVCDVPWAIIHVDGRGEATHCAQAIAGALPMARISVHPGQHTLLATAEGFAPYTIYVVAHIGVAGLYLTQFSLTLPGSAEALGAVNSYFAKIYTQDVTFPTEAWQLLGLRAPPASAVLVVQERFEAVALDSYEPTYSETTYQRPIAPQQGMLGVAVVVTEHVMIRDGCGMMLLERRLPVLYMTRASITFSVQPGPRQWVASTPYALNPTADIYTAPNVAASPATPAGLLALTARTDLAGQLGHKSLLAGAVTVTSLTTASQWGAGAVLTLPDGTRPPPGDAVAPAAASWLYISGALLALTSSAQALSPNVPKATLPMTLDSLRASLARPSSLPCSER